MHPQHICSQDCETIHREISKKIVSIILNSHKNIDTNANTQPMDSKHDKNSWFGLKTEPYHLPDKTNTETDEAIKNFFLCKSEKDKEKVQIAIYLLNEGMTVGFEDINRGIKGPLKQSKILLELWAISFESKNILTEDLNRIYMQSSFYMRSLYSLIRLLPIQNLLLNPKFKLDFEISLDGLRYGSDTITVTAEKALKESLLVEKSENNQEMVEERVDEVNMGALQTGHGDLNISVKFRRCLSFYTIERSQAIKVPPKNVLKAKEIPIKSSPSSGDWVDMGKLYNCPVPGTGGLQIGSVPVGSVGRGIVTSKNAPGRIKIMTTLHKRENSTCNESTNNNISHSNIKMNLTDFIKTFERPEPLNLTDSPSSTGTLLNLKEIVETLERSRSEKINFDRWLEEVEISMEMANGDIGKQTFEDQFSLINLME